MRKIFGWVLVVAFILYALLPIHPFTVTKVVMSYNQLGLPVFETVEVTQYSWFVVVNTLELLTGDVAISIGRFLGYFMILGVGVWLIKRKKTGVRNCA